MLAKTKTRKNVGLHEKDTGSPEAQVLFITDRIDEIANHLKKNKKDVPARRGLLRLVSERRKHLRYLQKKNKDRYRALIKKLELN